MTEYTQQAKVDVALWDKVTPESIAQALRNIPQEWVLSSVSTRLYSGGPTLDMTFKDPR